MNRYLLSILVLLCVRVLSAQNLTIAGNIVIEDASTEGVRVLIFKNNEKIDEKIVSRKGKFDLKLALNADYKLSFEKEGYITKLVNINTEVPPEIIEVNPDFPPMKLIINLLPQVAGVDISIFDQPVAILAYNAELDDFTFDKDYASRIKERIMQTEEAIRKALAQRGSEAREKDRLFAELVSQGQRSFSQKKWQEAITDWTKALEIKPTETQLKEKLAIAQKEYEREKAQKSIEAQNERTYQLLVNTGDSLFTLKQYLPAKNKYQSALNIKQNAPYPIQKIKEIDILLTQIAKEQEETARKKDLAQKYQQYILLADQAFHKENYQEAATAYREALALNYEKDYPQNQLKIIEDIQRQKAESSKRQAELDARYEKMVTNADKSFTSNDFEEAIKLYRQASEIKPEEVYPKERIVKCEQALEQIRKRLEEEETKKRLEAQRRAELLSRYTKIIAEADAAFKAENYSLARSRYTEADQLNTGELYPKNKIKEIDDIFNSAKYRQRLAEYNKNKAIAEKANAEKNYASARFYYQKALDILPIDKETIQAKIAEIEKQIELERLAQIEKEYQEHITKADKAYEEKSYAIARFYYRKALDSKKNDPYATGRLKEVEEFIKNRSEKTVEL